MNTELPDSPLTVEGGDLDQRVSYLLNPLREKMVRAREAFMAARRPPAGPMQLKDARAEYLSSLLAFHRALRDLGLPIPPGLRDELRLLRGFVPPADRQG